MKKNKGQTSLFLLTISIAILIVLFLFLIIYNAGIQKKVIEGITYKEEAVQTHSELYSLLNYNNCSNEVRLSLKELIGFCLVNDDCKSNGVLSTLDYGGQNPKNPINIKPCIEGGIQQIKTLKSEVDTFREFYVDFENVKYFEINDVPQGETKSLKQELKITIPIPKENKIAIVVLKRWENPKEV